MLSEDEIVARDGISYEQAMTCIQSEDEKEIREMMAVSGRITRRLHGNRVDLCGIVNAKSGLCAEDCAFCAQAVKFPTQVRRYPLLDVPTSLTRAKEAKERGVREFCIVTSGESLTDREFEQLLHSVISIKKTVDIQLDVSIGFLSCHRARQLKAAGVTRVNHNVQTSPSFYSHLVSTHTYDRRIQTMKAIKEAALELCCGVILGVGESREDRVRAAFEIKEFKPECVPINLLDPRPGTPLANEPLMETMEILKTIAVFRFILLETCLKLAGGRHVQLGSYQRLALQAGINGLIVGEYLTTKGSALSEDIENLQALGFEYE